MMCLSLCMWVQGVRLSLWGHPAGPLPGLGSPLGRTCGVVCHLEAAGLRVPPGEQASRAHGRGDPTTDWEQDPTGGGLPRRVPSEGGTLEMGPRRARGLRGWVLADAAWPHGAGGVGVHGCQGAWRRQAELRVASCLDQGQFICPLFTGLAEHGAGTPLPRVSCVGGQAGALTSLPDCSAPLLAASPLPIVALPRAPGSGWTGPGSFLLRLGGSVDDWWVCPERLVWGGPGSAGPLPGRPFLQVPG